jgi:uncharacterized cupredoxin-like copper-binding protein
MPASRAALLRSLATASMVVLLAACGSSPATSSGPAVSVAASPTEAASSNVAASASPAASPSAQASASAAAGGLTLAMTAQEYGFVGPSTAAAGITTVSLENVGKEEHQAQLVRLNEGTSFGDLTGALATGDPTAALALVTLSGGPTAVMPGATGQTTQDLSAGSYAFLCFIQSPDGVPHVAKGMILPLTVTGTSAGGSLPAGDASVTAKDFTFDVAAAVAPGEHTFTFKNDGPQPHEAGIVKLTGGMTVDQIKAIFTASPAPSGEAPQGPPPFEDYGGNAAIAPGATSTFTVNIEAGAQYAFICFVPDPATGKAHAELGMITEIPTQ